MSERMSAHDWNELSDPTHLRPKPYALSNSTRVVFHSHRPTALSFDMLSDVMLFIMPLSWLFKVMYKFLLP